MKDRRDAGRDWRIPICGERECKLPAHRRAGDPLDHRYTHPTYMAVPAGQPVTRGYDAWGLVIYAGTLTLFAGLIVAAIIR